MTPDPTLCARARLARDARFDGRFFIAVSSTGVYCRPICPVQPPKEDNVRYFPSAWAAAAAGFRPCLRCRPEVAAGWTGSAATVSRALRAIAAGALDGGTIPTLARTLGVGPRHLRRLFVEHLGAPPSVVARQRRLQLARQLLDGSALSLAEVAHAAGFGSLRRFHAAVRESFGRTPQQLRERAAPSAEPGLRLALSYRPPFAWEQALDWYGKRALPGVEQVDGQVYRRNFRLDGQDGSLALRPAHSTAATRNSLELYVLFPDPRRLLAIAGRVRRQFDLDADPAPVARCLEADPALARRLQRLPGVRLPGAFAPFEMAVRAVLGQRISVAAATTLAGRVVERCGRPVASPWPALTRRFPTPAELATADLDGLGLSGSARRTLKTLAEAVRDGALALDSSRGLDDFVRRFTALRGIGPWTAHTVAMRALGEPDAFPASDLGLLKAGVEDKPAALRARAERWRPWRAYAAMLLWNVEEEV